MNSHRYSIRSVFALFLLIATVFSQTTLAATKHTTRKSSSSRTEKRRSSAKTSRAERRRIEARRRAELARLAALARQRAAEEAMRERVQSMIANDDVAGEDPEIRRVAVNALGNHAGTVVVMDPKSGHLY